jgi:UDP-glucose 4-epimerase
VAGVPPEQRLVSGASGGVLVTGGSGFIGRHVVAQLQSRGHRVLNADRVPHPDGVETVVGELNDPRVVAAAVGADIDAIVHLAAETSVLGSIERPALVHDTNVTVTAALLEAAREKGVGRFVLASSNSVVGEHEGTMTEDVPLRPLTPYGATKAAGEMLLSGYAGAFGLVTPVLRLTNVYGPGMLAKDSFVPRMMRAAAAGEGVTVYGDGRQRRDLVHVGDVARAFAMAVEGWPSGPVIIGSATSHTVLDMLEAARAATGAPIPVEHVEQKKGEMRAVVVDTGLARSRGFEPTVSLEEGMASVWPDFRPVDVAV